MKDERKDDRKKVRSTKDERRKFSTLDFTFSTSLGFALSTLLCTSLLVLYLVLQRKLLYFALSTSYFGESRSFGESRYGDGSIVGCKSEVRNQK